jgi:hypothetical protein
MVKDGAMGIALPPPLKIVQKLVFLEGSCQQTVDG